MSLRALGEGHVSSIEFRTGTIDASGSALLDDPGAYPETGRNTPGPYEKHLFHTKLAENRCDNNAAALVLDRLDDHFGADQLRSRHRRLAPRARVPGPVRNAVERIRWVAANNYTVEFRADTAISERVLWPNGPSELHGMEDARFVRFVDDDGAVTYRATYTAFDGSLVAPQLLSTTDFATFVVTQLSGPYATNKGLALFPRKVGGRYLALSRWDRERLAVTVSDDGTEWVEATTLELPAQAVGPGPSGQLRLAAGNGQGLARAHPRGRPHAQLCHRRRPARPR